MFFNYSINLLYCLKIHLINLLIQLSPLKIITGKVHLSSIHTNFARIELG